ncbi:MAG: dipeptidase PepE [Curvibacter sp.]|nr:dipeptidase PepE [Curvibacter sp.]
MNHRHLLLMSSSRKDQLGYLEHAHAQIHALLQHRQQQVVFIPYAAVSFDYERYEDMVRPVFEQLGYGFSSLHRHADPQAALQQADAIAVGGGNTFALLKRLQDAGLMSVIQDRVRQGAPYIGWSAGGNVAGPTIRTTNDMPIVQPASLRGLGLLPFQVNPHFTPGKPPGHNGESREERLAEFLALNAPEELVALPEGSALLVEGDQVQVLGERGALHFRPRGEVLTLHEGKRFALSRIQGPADMAGWPDFLPPN